MVQTKSCTLFFSSIWNSDQSGKQCTCHSCSPASFLLIDGAGKMIQWKTLDQKPLLSLLLTSMLRYSAGQHKNKRKHTAESTATCSRNRAGLASGAAPTAELQQQLCSGQLLKDWESTLTGWSLLYLAEFNLVFMFSYVWGLALGLWGIKK